MGAVRVEGAHEEYLTRCFDALGRRFAVRTSDPAVGRYVDRAFGSLATEHEPEVVYSFIDHGPRHRGGGGTVPPRARRSGRARWSGRALDGDVGVGQDHARRRPGACRSRVRHR